MAPPNSTLRIDPHRFQRTFEELAAIGTTLDSGVHRPAFSASHQQARQWFFQHAVSAGLEVGIDRASNHSALLRCGSPWSPTLLLGSHLDSVPYGGRFDGALGVVAALECLKTVSENHLVLGTHLEAIDFTDEEGYFVGFLGSMALSGQLEAEHLQNARGARKLFLEKLAELGLSEETLFLARRDPASLAGYLELHIEQGRRLLDQEVQIGIVTTIVGIRSFRLHFLGRADHAGTTPMDRRRDAGLGASAFALAARDLVLRDFPGAVVTVGNVDYAPGAFNVVPESATVSLEFRSDDPGRLEAIESALLAQAAAEAERFDLQLEVDGLDSTAPTRLDKGVQETIARACEILDLTYTFLPSGAGHDAQIMAQICPAGLIFAPSADGASHSAREFTSPEDCRNGTNVLLQTALLLAEEGI
jgi:N-carbamoyl-L-amino-acid hydrolase